MASNENDVKAKAQTTESKEDTSSGNGNDVKIGVFKDNLSVSKEDIDALKENPLCPFRRGGIDDGDKDPSGNIWEWKTSKPDYSRANVLYLRTKINKWKADSLEGVVSNLVKAMEMELTHKPDIKQWVCMDSEIFTYETNGNGSADAKDTVAKGTYNILLKGAKNNSDNSLYDINCEWTKSHESFKEAFPSSGFLWELLKVYSGPPNVAFKWHHWGLFDGKFNGKEGDGTVKHIYGWAIAKVKFDENQNVILTKVDIFYDVEKFLAEMNSIDIPKDSDPKEFYG